ncbi:MAG: hypothetical protein A2Y97_02035 [Nitrospirae bacterium RBG_13_39_12]|nr:MAG: hypothetical protein A2Y97_02035 [Nitrospirae bacterium RBG_13_39_12]
MRVFNLILLLFLLSILLIYTLIGLRFSFSKKHSKHLTVPFVIGIVIGVIGGFIVIYQLKISSGSVSFDIELSRWLAVTVIAIILGGLLSLYIFLRMRRK